MLTEHVSDEALQLDASSCRSFHLADGVKSFLQRAVQHLAVLTDAPSGKVAASRGAPLKSWVTAHHLLNVAGGVVSKVYTSIAWRGRLFRRADCRSVLARTCPGVVNHEHRGDS